MYEALNIKLALAPRQGAAISKIGADDRLVCLEIFTLLWRITDATRDVRVLYATAVQITYKMVDRGC